MARLGGGHALRPIKTPRGPASTGAAQRVSTYCAVEVSKCDPSLSPIDRRVRRNPCGRRPEQIVLFAARLRYQTRQMTIGNGLGRVGWSVFDRTRGWGWPRRARVGGWMQVGMRVWKVGLQGAGLWGAGDWVGSRVPSRLKNDHRRRPPALLVAHACRPPFDAAPLTMY